MIDTNFERDHSEDKKAHWKLRTTGNRKTVDSKLGKRQLVQRTTSFFELIENFTDIDYSALKASFRNSMDETYGAFRVDPQPAFLLYKDRVCYTEFRSRPR